MARSARSESVAESLSYKLIDSLKTIFLLLLININMESWGCLQISFSKGNSIVTLSALVTADFGFGGSLIVRCIPQKQMCQNTVDVQYLTSMSRPAILG